MTGMDKICSILECGKPIRARGWCTRHYTLWRQYGSPLVKRNVCYADPHDGIAARTEKSGDCILWTGAKDKNGYGHIFRGGVHYSIHRWVYEDTHGKIPDGMQIDHRCRNRACINVEHLRLATGKQNQENKVWVNPASKSGLRGVYSRNGKWQAVVVHNRVTYRGAIFSDVMDANAEVIAMRNKLYTHNEMDRTASVT